MTSMERLKKKIYRALRPVGDEKKTYPAGAPETNPYFFLALWERKVAQSYGVFHGSFYTTFGKYLDN